MTDTVLDIIGSIFLLCGCAIVLISVVGLVRYPELMARQHVASKPQIFALILNLVGAALIVRNSIMSWTFVLVIAFQLITAPISAHMIARAGYRTGRIRSEELCIDELRDDISIIDRGSKPE